MARKQYTKDRLASLNADFRPLIEALLRAGEAIGLDIQISCGHRTGGEQDALYSVGRTRPGKIVTNAKAGQSAHNYGLAVDIFFLEDGKASFSPALYRRLDKAVKAVGLYEKGLSWSGNWVSFKETAHWEATNWKEIAKNVKQS